MAHAADVDRPPKKLLAVPSVLAQGAVQLTRNEVVFRSGDHSLTDLAAPVVYLGLVLRLIHLKVPIPPNVAETGANLLLNVG